MNNFLFARTGRGREPRVVRAVLSLTSAHSFPLLSRGSSGKREIACSLNQFQQIHFNPLSLLVLQPLLAMC